MKTVQSVVYETNDGEEQFALVTSQSGNTCDLLTFDKNGAGSHRNNVPRNDDGGGHTWHPAK